MIVIGIDPAVAPKKPIAMVAIDTEARRVCGCVEHYVKDDPLWDKLGYWRFILACFIAQQEPALVAIEDARGVGGKGSGYLQTLVTLLAEQAEACGVECVLVNPQSAKSAVCPVGGLRNKRAVAKYVRMLYDCSKLPAGYDYTDAVAIAHAGEVTNWLQQDQEA